jgi:cell division protease FtsH
MEGGAAEIGATFASVTEHHFVSELVVDVVAPVVAYARSTQLLTDNIDKLHVMAETLLQYETIDAHQIDDIMAGRVPGPPADWSKNGPAGPVPPLPPRGDAGSSKLGNPAIQS